MLLTPATSLNDCTVTSTIVIMLKNFVELYAISYCTYCWSAYGCCSHLTTLISLSMCIDFVTIISLSMYIDFITLMSLSVY